MHTDLMKHRKFGSVHKLCIDKLISHFNILFLHVNIYNKMCDDNIGIGEENIHVVIMYIVYTCVFMYCFLCAMCV